jgi:hypothetical protein
MEFLMGTFCAYCGFAQRDRLGCCGEARWVTGREFYEYHGCLAEDDDNDEGYERIDAAPDYRTAEQYFADQAHEKKRKHLNGEY